jgi:OmcA/MtrC family decaheme c-type cytochrome
MKRLLLLVSPLVALLLVVSCTGGAGPAGPAGPAGAVGAPGAAGASGPRGGAVRISDIHGGDIALEEELGGALPATVAVTSATADAAGVAKVVFTVKDAAGKAVTGKGASANASSFAIASLEPKGNGLSYNKWVPFIWRNASEANQAYRERNTTTNMVEGPAGTYTYTFAQNLAQAKMPVGGTAVTYDRNRTFRVMVALRGAATGYVGGTTFDFVPAGGAVSATRDIVDDATCRKCHMATPGHYGPWDGIVKACVMCHTDGNTLVNTAANGGATNTLQLSVMLHKIHAGRELPSVSGPDKQFYDNPNTPIDETKDNGKLYQLNAVSTWNTAAFPAVIENCEACHTGTVKDVANWKTVPSRAACGSCHDNIDWTTGKNHSAGNVPMANDDGCASCHPATGKGPGQSVTDAHNWTTKDKRNIPEFDITVTLDTPARGYYINGEKPVATIVLKDHLTGVALDHNTIIQDPVAEGSSTPRDGLFTAANVYVVGPRGDKVVNLTYAARAAVRSASAGPWDLSAGGGSLRVKVDSAMPMLAYDTAKEQGGYGSEGLIPGDITVTLPAAGAALKALFANPAAATAAEVAAWLNADATFQKRAVAYVDEALAGNTNAGRLAIRTRGIAKMDKSGAVVETYDQRNIQLVAMPVAGMFAAADVAPANTSWKTAGGADSARKMTIANATVPKAVFSTASIKYTMDPVDDLIAGTYIIHLEFADAGRAPAPANPAEPPYVDYVTPSVAIANFQVKTATVEKPVAGSCTSCHWSSAGIGLVFDFPRHDKIFDEKATDRCGGCHDYLSGQKPDSATQLSFAGALSNRVHAVHNGSNLNYPTITVNHEETAAFGRNWNITYPQNILNCESCHPKATTSGTWMTNPNRLACSGCHDSDAASAHMKINTYDPTPLAPFSGDEQESCKACH